MFYGKIIVTEAILILVTCALDQHTMGLLRPLISAPRSVSSTKEDRQSSGGTRLPESPIIAKLRSVRQTMHKKSHTQIQKSNDNSYHGETSTVTPTQLVLDDQHFLKPSNSSSKIRHRYGFNYGRRIKVPSEPPFTSSVYSPVNISTVAGLQTEPSTPQQITNLI